MSRPLKYDDQFKSIIREKIHDKFLYCINLKVQSTAFYKMLNLQYSLIISSLYDIIIGILALALFLNTLKFAQENFSYFIEVFILMIGILFGILGINTATNLNKKYSKIYLIWKSVITFSLLFFEIFYNFSVFGQLVSNWFAQLFLLCLFTFIHLYLMRLSWSFYVRLIRGHELLIIHGKYLESMMLEEERSKYHPMQTSIDEGTIGKYVPPQVIPSTEMNLISFTNQ